MTALYKPLAVLTAINLVLAKVFRNLAWVLLALMTGIVVLQVFFRYILNSSLGWSEDVSLMMMIWVAFAVAPIAYRTGANVALDTFSQFLHGRVGFLLQLLIHLLLLIMLAVLISEALALIGRSRIRANTVPVQMKYIYMIMPVSFAAMMIAGAELILRCFSGLVRPDSDAARMPSAQVDTDPDSLQQV